MSMPAIDIGALFIGREDREGDDGSGIATEDDDDTYAKVGWYACDYLEVVLCSMLQEQRWNNQGQAVQV
jgi:hypothetical protein